jgi:hypothetical protein
LTCADTLVAMRVTAPQDRAAVKEWIDGCGDASHGKQVLDSLAGLQRGEAWVWYPEGGFLQRMKAPPIKTYDSSAAPVHGAQAGPKVGEINLSEVKAALSEAVKEAESNDPKLLRARIAELERSAKAKQPTAVDQSALDRAHAAGKAEAAREWQARDKEQSRIIGTLTGKLGRGAKAAGELAALLHVNGEAVPSELPKTVYQPSKPIAAPPERKLFTKQVKETAEGITGPQQAILDTIATLNVRGIQANRDSIARWLDLHPNGGSYGTNLGYLRSQGYLEGCTLTDSGQAAARANETGIDAALAALPDEPKRNIIRVLLAASGPLSRDELAAALGLHPNGGSYGTNLGRLRTMGLITERGPIQVTEGAMR